LRRELLAQLRVWLGRALKHLVENASLLLGKAPTPLDASIGIGVRVPGHVPGHVGVIVFIIIVVVLTTGRILRIERMRMIVMMIVMMM